MNMGWVMVRDIKTGKSTLLGEPELMRDQPPEELGSQVYKEWLYNHKKVIINNEGDQ
jgi:hypothetical protein